MTHQTFKMIFTVKEDDFNCQTRHLQWYQTSDHLERATGYGKMNDNSLRIEGVEVADAGPYICHAQNSAGSVMAQITLEVDGRCIVFLMHFNENFRYSIFISIIIF